jgi:hypothetical protein
MMDWTDRSGGSMKNRDLGAPRLRGSFLVALPSA